MIVEKSIFIKHFVSNIPILCTTLILTNNINVVQRIGIAKPIIHNYIPNVPSNVIVCSDISIPSNSSIYVLNFIRSSVTDDACM